MANLPVPQDSLTTYLTEINRFPLLSPDEEHRLAVRFKETGDVDAAQSLVTSNLRFVVKVANEYRHYGVRMADLIQEGNIGLMHAVKKFDPHKGFRLISYAVWWIRAYIQNFILRTWSLVKIGTTQAQRKLFYKLNQVKGRLATHLPNFGHLNDEACESLAKGLKVKGNDVIEMEARLKARDASLDAPLNEDSQRTRLDLLAAPANQEEELAAAQERVQLKNSVQEALTNLNGRERFIVQHRLMADEPLTLESIGQRFKISRERARQIEEAAKKKIRFRLESSEAHGASRAQMN